MRGMPHLSHSVKVAGIVMAWWAGFMNGAPAEVTLRMLGARGDGLTDDREAIARALEKKTGRVIDGEGLTYAVHGSIHVRVPVELKNLTLKQTMGSFDTSPYIRSTHNPQPPQVAPPEALVRMVHGMPWLRPDGVATYAEDPVVTEPDLRNIREMLNIRTLFIYGTEEKPVSVKLERVKILRGGAADTGMHSNAAGLYLVNAGPVSLTDIEITGDGKGSGLFLSHCRQVRIDGLNIHDMLWAPYRGDVEFTEAELRGDFRWNNSPIYDFNERAGRFIRVRVQEQLTGMTLNTVEDVEMVRSRIERIGTTIDGKFLPWQADGVTVGSAKGLTIRDCEVGEVWEGIDLTGAGVDGFLQENIRIHDTFAYGFKYAHPQKNGRVVGCVSERAGYRSFTIGSECENIEFVNCTARETGVQGYWRREGQGPSGICGFELGFGEGLSPRRITLKDCRAENTGVPTTMEYGFFSNTRAAEPEFNIRLIHPTVVGASVRDVAGFRVE
jgi:hypothetical protein